MPGTIRVSDGTTLEGVTAEVTLGPRLFKTQPGVVDRGRIETWNSDFAFPVMNLRDKLVVSICDSEDHSMTQTAIEIPSIIQKGSRDEFVSLNKGGRIHLRMSFVLTDEEREKIDVMRVAALKSREEAERLKKIVDFQPVHDPLWKELKKSPDPAGAIADVDVSTTYEKKDLKEYPNGSLGLYTTPKPLAPQPTAEQERKPSSKPVLNPMFNYTKAIGVKSGFESIERRSKFFVPDNLIKEVIASNGNMNSGVQRMRDAGDFDISGTTKLDASPVASLSSLKGTRLLVTKSIDSIPQSNRTPRGQDSLMNVVNAHNLENAELDSPEDAQLHVSLVSSSSSKGPVSLLTKPTGSKPLVENLSYEIKAKNRARNSEAESVRECAENAGSSGACVLNISDVDASAISEPGAASLAMISIESTYKAPGQPSGISSSGPMTWKTVEARVKRTFPKVPFKLGCRRASSRTVVARAQPPVSVVWLQDWVRKALSNFKGCCHAPA